jgi:hypothetical protein
MTDRKKPGMAFWASVALVVVLAYPLSFGPACWLYSYGNLPGRTVARVYRPILLLSQNRSPAPVRDFLFWYGDLFQPLLFNRWPTAMELCHEAEIPCLLIPPGK